MRCWCCQIKQLNFKQCSIQISGQAGKASLKQTKSWTRVEAPPSWEGEIMATYKLRSGTLGRRSGWDCIEGDLSHDLYRCQKTWVDFFSLFFDFQVGCWIVSITWTTCGRNRLGYCAIWKSIQNEDWTLPWESPGYPAPVIDPLKHSKHKNF